MQRIRVLFKDIEDVNAFYEVVSQLNCEADIGKGSTFYDAKSMLGLLNLHLDEAQYLMVNSDEDCSEMFKRWAIQ